MLKDLNNILLPTLDEAVDAEIEYIRKIGSNINLVFACSNLGAYEALLYIIRNRERGVPVYNALASVSSNFSGPAGVNYRLKNLRKLGLLEERSGVKKSQICLAPTQKLLEELSPILCERHQGLLLR